MSATRAILADGVRQAFGDVSPVLGTLAWLAGLLLVFVPLSVRAFRRA